ncbi:hypothetical protein TeGR_g11145 [Tetraparma gracilis]|jgi:hypothetical protein|uniref:Sorting nexin/Vps5-like C-terminal domain-containing protein n=1 Tax=Tetraparma gracilis TaxID=2962635 RepID=A0ABQ6NCH0_9STRA|nr:hypothetical protein TeGR_g11145 [Tetraparma gracilis]
MELSKLVKDTTPHQDPSDAAPIRILSNNLLRSGRRSKRNAMELSAAVMPLVRHHRAIPGTRAALEDRIEAIKARVTAAHSVENKTHKLSMLKSQSGQADQVGRMEMEVDVARQVLKQRQEEAQAVGETLRSEVARVEVERKREYANAIKICASSFAQSAAENLAIWETAREQFEKGMAELDAAAGAGGGRADSVDLS